MAEFDLDLSGFQEMIDTLGRMEDGEKVFTKALNEGIKPVVDALKRHVPVLTGKLRDSVTVGKVRKSKSGSYSQIAGPKGEFYGIYSEHGTSKQPAKPWMRPAFDESQAEAYKIIEETLQNGIKQSFENKG